MRFFLEEKGISRNFQANLKPFLEVHFPRKNPENFLGEILENSSLQEIAFPEVFNPGNSWITAPEDQALLTSLSEWNAKHYKK